MSTVPLPPRLPVAVPGVRRNREDEGRAPPGEAGLGGRLPAASGMKETDMQNVVFAGRLAADPQVTDDFGKAVFRLLENRGRDAAGKPRVVGVNCVSWAKGLNERVIAEGLAMGCEVVVVGAFVDNRYQARDGGERTAKELVVNRLTVLDWASDQMADAGAAAA